MIQFEDDDEEDIGIDVDDESESNVGIEFQGDPNTENLSSRNKPQDDLESLRDLTEKAYEMVFETIDAMLVSLDLEVDEHEKLKTNLEQDVESLIACCSSLGALEFKDTLEEKGIIRKPRHKQSDRAKLMDSIAFYNRCQVCNETINTHLAIFNNNLCFRCVGYVHDGFKNFKKIRETE